MATEPADADVPMVFDVLRGDALEVKTTPYGAVGTVFSSAALEVVWVSKQNEEIETGWFSQSEPDILLVVQGSCGSTLPTVPPTS
jgi:hypothetical protein